ncbi:hypothetical protein PCH_Pc22g03210 [Penicillium rubens Wisconsin 54-1255]|uniref:Uncharacterized protein n=1 Tax=Penicillium rubens (strain ATCC 28089 / DSM 1075 / NRRL 1951 / Wisconsin 54-1255) TaxID=500485 RepID=B6HRB0_PENRW|nr:hypothetical protein PCH_Pc22g03210 [Penicillium rubens Wisconsin 54-1255]
MGSKQTLPNKGPGRRSPAGQGFLNFRASCAYMLSSQENLSFSNISKFFCALSGGKRGYHDAYTATLKVSTLEPDRRSSFCPSCLASPCSLDNPERLGERSDPFPFLSALTPYKLCRSLIQGSGSTCLRPPQTRFTSSFDDCSTASGLVKEGYIPVGGYPEQTLFGVGGAG